VADLLQNATIVVEGLPGDDVYFVLTRIDHELLRCPKCGLSRGNVAVDSPFKFGRPFNMVCRTGHKYQVEVPLDKLQTP
jgi:hypothetical protein